MSKSLCFKTNNEKAINYLLNKFHNMNLSGFYFSKCKFKNYWNLIIHYTGKNLDSFFYFVSKSLSECVCDVFEKVVLRHLISTNYFYFTDVEQDIIFNNCLCYLKDSSIDENYLRKDYLYVSFFEYIQQNKKMILEGFINFRIQDYIKILDSIVDLSVNKFVIDREYNNFVELIKSYIESKSSLTEKIHLLYSDGESSLLGENLEPIELNHDRLYLSDISFSSNDYSLNSLLSLLPREIVIHIIDKEDEFINTLKLIFGKHVSICKSCKLCTNRKSKYQSF